MKRIAVLSAVVVFLFLLCVSAYGYTVSRHDVFENCITVDTADGIWLISFSGTDWRIEKAAPDTLVRELSLSYPIASVAMWNDTAAALCDDCSNDQVILYTYEIDADYLDSIALPAESGYHRGFYCDGSFVLIQSDDHPSVIYRYSVGGRKIDSFDFASSNASMIYDNSGRLYVLADERIYRYESGRYRMLGGETLNGTAKFIADNTLIDSTGTVYRISNDDIRILMQSDHIDTYTAAAVSDHSLYISDGGIIYCCDLSTGVKTHYFKASVPIRSLYRDRDVLYAVSDNVPASVLRIFPADLIPCPADEGLDPVGSLTSGAYRIDASNLRITHIPAQTTLAVLKSNLNYDGHQLQLFSGNKIIKSGYVGTAMTLVLTGDDTCTYELSVIGDITGEGNVNSRDLHDLMDYFLGNITFNGVYSIAVDLNDNGIVDISDLALLCRMVAN